MKQKGFIKVRRNLLSDPQVAALIEQEGATGLGTYIIILLYLSTCDDFEGAFTHKQLYLLAATARKLPSYVRHLIEDYGLFVVENRRFRSSIMVEPSSNGRSTAVQYPPANLSLRAGEEIEIDKEKEKKKKLTGVCLSDTPVAFDKNGRPLHGTD